MPLVAFRLVVENGRVFSLVAISDLPINRGCQKLIFEKQSIIKDCNQLI